MVHSNIFKTRNDWAVITLKCKKHKVIDRVISMLVRVIKEETGFDPLNENYKRKRDFVQSRQLFVTMMCKYTKRTLSCIGGIIGKDHATVLHSQKAVQNMIDTDKRFKDLYDRIDLKVKLNIN